MTQTQIATRWLCEFGDAARGEAALAIVAARLKSVVARAIEMRADVDDARPWARALFADAACDADAIDAPVDDAIAEAVAADPTALIGAYEAALQAVSQGRTTRRKHQGAYGTPPAIVDAVIEQTLAAMGESHDTLTLLDPACGGGAFLVRAQVAWASSPCPPRDECEHQPDLNGHPVVDVEPSRASGGTAKMAVLRGLDVDPLEACAQVAWASSPCPPRDECEHQTDLNGQPVVDVEPSRASGGTARMAVLRGLDVDPLAVGVARAVMVLASPPTDIGKRVGVACTTVRCVDALLGEPPANEWAADAVVTNPPWVSHSGRHAEPVDADVAAALAARYRAYRGWPSLHACFVERCLELVRPCGAVGIVLPRAVAHQDGYAAMREVVEDACVTWRFIDLGETAFSASGVNQPACALIATRKGATGSAPRRTPTTVATVPTSNRRVVDGELPDSGVTFGRCFRDCGVHTGNVGRLIVQRAGGEPRADLVDYAWEPVREGRDIDAFSLRPPTARLCVDAPPSALKPDAYVHLRRVDQQLDAPILLRQTAPWPIACRHADPRARFRNSVLAAWPVEGLTVEAMLVLLNSSPVRSWYQARFVDAQQRTFPQVKVKALAAIPLPGQDRWDRLCTEAATLVGEIEARGFDDVLSARVDGVVCAVYSR